MAVLLIGMLLGAMVATLTGRSIGNQVGDAMVATAKKAVGASKTVPPEGGTAT